MKNKPRKPKPIDNFSGWQFIAFAVWFIYEVATQSKTINLTGIVMILSAIFVSLDHIKDLMQYYNDLTKWEKENES